MTKYLIGIKNIAIILLFFLCASAKAGTINGHTGVTSIHIDYLTGNDVTGDGSQGSPIQNHPFFKNFSGTYTHAPGDNYIFKGGVVWPQICFLTGIGLSVGGSSGSPDFYGIDSNWFFGSSFSRPIFDGNHVSPLIFFINPSVNYINFNCLEMRAINCTTSLGQGLISGENVHDITATNCYLHDWTINKSALPDSAHGGFIFQFNGGYGITNLILDHTEISNVENGMSTNWNGVCVRQCGIINYCNIHDNSSGILFAQDLNHSQVWNIHYPYNSIDETYHFNGFAMDDGNGNGDPTGINEYCRNSYFHDISGGANMCYASCAYYDCYIYNNLFYGVQPAQQCIEIDPIDPGISTGVAHSTYMYNNTLNLFNLSWSDGIILVIHSGLQINNLFATNNHFIGVSASVPTYHGNSSAAVNGQAGFNIAMTPVIASTYGYTSNTLYAPGFTNAPTVSAGANLTSLEIFTTDILSSNRPPTGSWDIGAYQLSFNSNTNSTNILIKGIQILKNIFGIKINHGVNSIKILH